MKKETRCTVFTGRRVVELQRFPIPEVDDDKLLVKIEACGICIWEQCVFTGSINTDYPLIGGHEMIGRIKTIGKDAHGDWEAGQRVIVSITLPCRSCYFCKTYEEQSYQNFNTAQVLSGQLYPGIGGLSKCMMAVPYSTFPYTNVTPQEVCICEPVSCTTHSTETVNPQFGDACVIIEVDIMGLLHTQLCVKKGCFIIVVDMNEERLEMMASIGVCYTINPRKGHAEKKTMKITYGRETRVVFDTTPAASVVEEVCYRAGNMGELMIYSDIYPSKPVQMDARWTYKGSIQILGTANSDDHDSTRVACMISEGTIGVKPSISGAYPVEEVSNALASSCQGSTFRNIITLSKGL